MDRGHLKASDQLRVQDLGRLGPLIELAIARAASPAAFASVNTEGQIFEAIDGALHDQRISGHRAHECQGAIPLGTNGSGADVLTQWQLRLQTAATENGWPRQFSATVVGVLGELVDNIGEHADGPTMALAAFRVTPRTLEIVAADAGIGALSSLRRNPRYANLVDAAAALNAIVYDGATRHPDGSNHGHGIKQVFRALVGRNGYLRFRSGDHSLALGSDGPIDRGHLESRSEFPLPGFCVNVVCLQTTTPTA